MTALAREKGKKIRTTSFKFFPLKIKTFSQINHGFGNMDQVGDTFDIITTCDETRETCESKFSNIINFRGEPDRAWNRCNSEYRWNYE